MQQFDDYINTILKDLNVSKSKKKDIADEFLDHLVMLKNEHMANGLTEIDAIKQAMMCFGKENELSRKLSVNLCNYLSILNISAGIILFLLLFKIGSLIAVPGIPLHVTSDESFVGLYISSLSGIILFMPLGYFLPMFIRRMRKIGSIILLSTVTGVLWVAFIYSRIQIQWDSLKLIQIILFALLFPAMNIIIKFIGYSMGFALLKLLNNAAMFCSKLIYR